MDERAIYAASALVAALSFAALCVYLIRTLVSARQTMESLKTTVEEAGATVESLRGNVQELTSNVNEISINVKQKLHAADALFQAAKEAGATLQETTRAAKEVTGTLSKAVREQASKPDKPWVAWVTAGVKVATAIRQAVKAKAAEQRPAQANRSGL